MSVYVSPLYDYSKRPKFALLYADTADELEAMARRLGLRLALRSAGTGGNYYTLSAGKRKEAIRFEAVEHTYKQKYRWQCAKRTGETPDE